MNEFTAEHARENMLDAPSEEFDAIINEIKKASKSGAGNAATNMALTRNTINKLKKLGFVVEFIDSKHHLSMAGLTYFIRWDAEQSTKNNLPERTFNNNS